MSNRIVVYKQCKYHKRTAKSLGGAWAESVCQDCKRLTFRATMAARGIKVVTPKYTGGWSRGTFPMLREPYMAEWCARNDERRASATYERLHA